MKLTIDHYLSQLSERDELDILLRNLLVVENYEVVKKASRGEREYGVDIAAVKKESNGMHLYLFQVKEGDIDRRAWSDGVNSVRSSLEEAIDKPFNALAKLQAPPFKTHIIVVFNGYFKQNTNELFNGFVEHNNSPQSEITYWNIDQISDKVQNSLVNEGLVPFLDTMLLKKTLAFADVPNNQFVELKQILSKLTESLNSNSAKKVRRMFATVRMLSRMTAAYARQGGTFKNAVIVSEMITLHMAHWSQNAKVFTPTAKEQFRQLLEDYSSDLSELFERLKPSIELKHGLALNSLGEQLEYPLRTFEILGLASIHALLKMHLGKDGYNEALGLVDKIISNNPSSSRPLIDNHGIDICLAILAYTYVGKKNLAPHVAIRVLDALSFRKKIQRPLPEFYNNIEAVMESIAYGELSESYTDDSSTIVTLLFETLLLSTNSKSDIYNDYRNVFEDVNLQCWYPPENYGDTIFNEEIRSGFTESSIPLPDTYDQFEAQTRERHQAFSNQWLSDDFSNKVNGFTVFIAFRHFRTPVFPHLWREHIFD